MRQTKTQQQLRIDQLEHALQRATPHVLTIQRRLELDPKQDWPHELRAINELLNEIHQLIGE